MAFGQPAGPPASPKQLQELISLLHDAGHADFRDARGPMGLNQRQSAGKFTRDEAAHFISRLQEAEADGTTAEPQEPPIRPFAAEAAMRDIPAGLLAAELRRRGWAVIEP